MNTITSQKAIDLINNEIACIKSTQCKREECNTCHLVMPEDDILEALNMAIEALKKEIPLVPEYISDGYAPDGTSVWDAHCPMCGHELDEDDICPNCGQAIYWE